MVDESVAVVPVQEVALVQERDLVDGESGALSGELKGTDVAEGQMPVEQDVGTSQQSGGRKAGGGRRGIRLKSRNQGDGVDEGM